MTEVVLRRAGIKIIENPPSPWLYVILTAFQPDGTALVAFTARIEVGSIVKLPHNNSFNAAIIWSANAGVHTVGNLLYEEAIRTTMGKLLRERSLGRK